jgi:hypothetical protein
MNIPATPARPLSGRLTLRSVSGPEDIARVAAFDALIHGPGNEGTWRAWMTDHPHAAPNGWLLVEEDTSRRVVASLCLLPWRLRYEGLEIVSGEMGVVGTLEEYRGRGVQRALNQRFDELLRAGGFHLSHIQGIPYFYRQFGYEYAAPLEAWWRLELHMVPAERAGGYACRPVTDADIPALTRLYDEAGAALGLSAPRDEAIWRYALGPQLHTETAAETWVVTDAAGEVRGSFRVARLGFGEGLIVAEASQLSAESALAALVTIRKLALERGKPFIRLNLPAVSPLVTAARSLGAHGGSAYGWQVRVPDPAHLLRAIAPALERRVGAGMFAGLTRTLTINLYRTVVELRFVEGRLVSVETLPGGAWGDLRLPPQLLAPLVLGHRSLDEMAVMYPDASADGQARALVDVLFPKMNSWLYQQY